MISAHRTWLDRELSAFAKILPEGSLVLDAGSGDQKYKSKFGHCRYESADFEQVDKRYQSSTYKCDLKAIPVEEGRFAAVVFTQVMEHLPEPSLVLDELFRVLKPGGRLFYTAPFWYEEHEVPYDFYRYTQFAVRFLFEKAGFEIVELRWLEGYMASVSHQLMRMSKALPKRPGDYGPGFAGVFRWTCFRTFGLFAAPLGRLAKRADVANRYVESGYPMSYVAIVRKSELQS